MRCSCMLMLCRGWPTIHTRTHTHKPRPSHHVLSCPSTLHVTLLCCSAPRSFALAAPQTCARVCTPLLALAVAKNCAPLLALAVARHTPQEVRLVCNLHKQRAAHKGGQAIAGGGDVTLVLISQVPASHPLFAAPLHPRLRRVRSSAASTASSCSASTCRTPPCWIRCAWPRARWGRAT